MNSDENQIEQQMKTMFVPILLLAVLGIGSYTFLAALIDKLNSVGSDLSKAIIAGTVTIFAAVITVVLGKIWEQKLKIKQEIREKKIPVYEQQIEAFLSLAFAEKCGDPKPTEQQIIKAFRIITEKLIVWGGPDVIKAWLEFRLNSSPEEVLPKIEVLMMAIRKDLGNSNASLNEGDLMKLFVNDYQSRVPVQVKAPLH